ncbi:MAG: c-type cytochrome [Gammaproteobacteria bacterium]|nr:MAG: c-type cytochrome [Gammaproteobacteria bacterium]
MLRVIVLRFFAFILGTLLITFSSLNVAYAADVEAGKMAYAVCAACHGANGEGNVALNSPKIAGQEPWYVRRQLELFRSGARGTAAGDIYGMQMRPMAMSIVDEAAIENLIAYVQTLPVNPPAITVEGDAAAGKVAYAVCAACHGANAEGLEQLGGPRLAGQEDWYLVRQINNFKLGRRGYHASDIFGAQMKPMASILVDDQAINNVTAYINSLR